VTGGPYLEVKSTESEVKLKVTRKSEHAIFLFAPFSCPISGFYISPKSKLWASLVYPEQKTLLKFGQIN